MTARFNESNLEWFFRSARHYVCIAFCLAEAVDEEAVERFARHIDDTLTYRFAEHTGIDPAGLDAASNFTLSAAEPGSGIDEALQQAADWFDARERSPEPLAGIYAIGSGIGGIAEEMSAPGARSVVIIMACHALADGLSLAAIGSRLRLTPDAVKSAAQRPLRRYLRSLAGGALTAVGNLMRAAITPLGTYRSAHCLADLSRRRVSQAASACGVGSEALCYALALRPLIDCGIPATIEVAFRAGAVRLAYEPFLRLAFSTFNMPADRDIAGLARALEQRLSDIRKASDAQVESMQAALSLTRGFFALLPRRLQHAALDRFFASRTVLSFYPLRPDGLLPENTQSVSSAAFSLLPSGVTIVFQVLPETIRVSITLEREAARRLGSFGEALETGLCSVGAAP